MKALVWIAKGLAAVAALVVLVWGISRALPVPAEHRQARALLEADPGFTGRNGFGKTNLLEALDLAGVPIHAIARDAEHVASLVAEGAAARAA